MLTNCAPFILLHQIFSVNKSKKLHALEPYLVLVLHGQLILVTNRT